MKTTGSVSQQQESPAPLAGLSIIVADDSATARAVVRATLERAGATVIDAADGAIAVRLALDTLPDAVVLDCGMEGINGYHACRMLRLEAATREIPILILTEGDAAAARFWVERAGADACLLKGDGPEALVQAIDAARRTRRGPDRAARPAGTPQGDAGVLMRLTTLLDRELLKATILHDVAALTQYMDDVPATLEQLGVVLRRFVELPFVVLAHNAPPGIFALYRTDAPPEALWRAVWTGPGRPAWPPAFTEGRQVVQPRSGESVALEGLRPRVLPAAPHWELVVFEPDDDDDTTARSDLLLPFAQAAALVVSNASLHGEAQRLALTDELTGVYNRRYVQGRLEVEIERTARTGGTVSLVLIDLDAFKLINDTHGHLVGDVALREVAQALRRILRPYDLIGRFGGEEFVIVAPDTPVEGAARLAERARETIEHVHTPEAQVRLTASIGIAAASRGEPGIDALLRRVDEALSRAKETGRNRVVIWSVG